MDKDQYVEDMMNELERLEEDAKSGEVEQVRASIRRMNALTKKLNEGLEDQQDS